jgi:plasmid stabilization system protein ParE
MQIWHYSFREWGEAQADKYYAEIKAGILKLQAHPHLGRSRDDLRAGY